MRSLSLAFSCFAFVALVGAPWVSQATPISQLKVEKVQFAKKCYSSLVHGTLRGNPVSLHFLGPSIRGEKRYPAELRIGPRSDLIHGTNGTTKLTLREAKTLVKSFDKQAASPALTRTTRARLKELNVDIRKLILE